MGPLTLSLSRLASWAESWKRHFKTLLAGRILVKPGWSKRKARGNQVEVILDPGLAFGTGQHPTTAFCLEQISSYSRPAPRQSLLDLGTGSGILAIAAARLGYAPILALDFDPEAVQVAKRNAQRNRVAGKVTVKQADVRRLSRSPRRRFDLICANLLADLLLSERDRIVAQLNPDGRLVVAGILRKEFEEMVKSYEAAGLCLRGKQSKKEWSSAVFEWPRPNCRSARL